MWARIFFRCAVLGAALFFSNVTAKSVAAESASPPPYPEFTFRRVTPPPPGYDGPRINIQIAPQAPTLPDLPQVEAPDATTPSATDWFWAEISPDAPADTSRFFAAQDHLGASPQQATLNAPRLATLTGIAQEHGQDILAASIGTNVSPALVLSVIAVESAGRDDAVSSAGAQGLMQLIPATADRFAVEDPFDPAENIEGGVAYLDWLLDEFDGDVILALAGYNAGEGAVTRNGGVPPFEETRTYVPRVIAAWMQARSLCLTPPELPSDGCVFQVMASN